MPQRHHDAGQPAAGAELVQGEVAGDLQQDVADEEDAGGEAELGGGEAEVVVHAVGAGERDRGAVQVVDEEHQGDERDKTHRDLAYRRTLDGRGGLREGLSGHGDSYVLRNTGCRYERL